MSAGTLLRRSFAFALVVGVFLRLATAPARPVEPAVEPIEISVADLDRAVAFYSEVLFFEKVSDDGQGVAGMRLGEDVIELTESAAAGRARQPLVIAVNDVEQAHLWLHRFHVKHRSVPTLVSDDPGAGDISAMHLEDPDGHRLQIVQFPPDQSAARWLRPTERVFLGIDMVPPRARIETLAAGFSLHRGPRVGSADDDQRGVFALQRSQREHDLPVGTGWSGVGVPHEKRLHRG